MSNGDHQFDCEAVCVSEPVQCGLIEQVSVLTGACVAAS